VKAVAAFATKPGYVSIVLEHLSDRQQLCSRIECYCRSSG